MSAAWLAVLVVGAATVALKGAGTLVLAGRPLPRPAAMVMPLLAPCLLAALVVGQTMADGKALVVDARAGRVMGLSASGRQTHQWAVGRASGQSSRRPTQP